LFIFATEIEKTICATPSQKEAYAKIFGKPS
jgi:hypothetical protein